MVYWIFLGLVILLTGCAALPDDKDRPVSLAFRDGRDTNLGQLIEATHIQNPTQSGFLIHDTGRQAFTQRLALVELAEQAIDAQYYIWNSDISGRLLAERLIRAADRGVRIRLLLDDFSVGDRDRALSALNAHSQIEVRVYNPFQRHLGSGIGRWVNFLAEFSRLNRRMHNKTFTVDNSVAIVGGRNIGDEYFDLHSALNFRDRDLLAVGPIVDRVNDNFDAYWNSRWVYPIAELTEPPKADEAQTLYQQLREQVAERMPLAYPVPSDQRSARVLLTQELSQLVWAEAELVFDRPDKPDDPTVLPANQNVGRQLFELANATRRELLLESAYLVPRPAASELFTTLHDHGVKIRALTNSLASNDVLPNHAGYARVRPLLLKEDVELFELRPDAASCRQVLGDPAYCDGDSLFSLHAKSVVFDRAVLYVGSFNLNQRSVYFNSETALIVHSPELAGRVADAIEENMAPENSWRVMLDDQGDLVWITQENGVEQIIYGDPEVSAWRRFKADFISLFPLEKYF
ncbi:MAG: phospholipase D family protein [Candidatus Competibacteraceae bacterium]|jgi:putative cardiolipin synthase|nr:phospholipase D family protein [Candidatus Competibacteraceae bacterium]